MAQTTLRQKNTAGEERLHVAFELGWTTWKLGFCARLDDKAWVVTIPARDIKAMEKTIAKARARFGVGPTCPVSSCYEAGRDGFWLDRQLNSLVVPLPFGYWGRSISHETFSAAFPTSVEAWY